MKMIGCKIFFLLGYGVMEIVFMIMNVYWIIECMGLIGFFLLGCEIKLVLYGEKLEVRVKGDCIMLGYYKWFDLIGDVFDSEGYYKLGDVVKFVDFDDLW